MSTLTNTFSEYEIFTLYRKRVKKFTGGDSSSLPVETAQELLKGLAYILSFSDGGGNIDRAFDCGISVLGAKRKSVYAMWRYACMRSPAVTNAFYDNTLKNIGEFFGNYDIYYMPHLIPCSIDYPLISPVSEDIAGVSFIEEYLKAILTETAFLKQFPEESIRRLYESSIPAYYENYFNLCEVMLANALGRAVLGLEIEELDISCTQRTALEARFSGMDSGEILSVLKNAFDGISDSAYLKSGLEGLAFRINAARGGLSDIFIELMPDGVITDTI